jgi:hypothetical protein
LRGEMTIFPLKLDFCTKSPLSAFCASGASGRRGMQMTWQTPTKHFLLSAKTLLRL